MNSIKIVQTAKDTTDRLAEKEVALATEKSSKGTVIKVESDKTFQEIIGFGGAFTEAAAYTLSKMEPAKREEIIKKYFDVEEGIGYTIGRVHIHSCDFALGNYTYVEEGDKELITFDISHEQKWVIPFIKEAMKKSNNEIKLLASPWSPPAWMKTNGEMNHGGQLLPEYREAWARYYAKFIKAMRAEGLNIWSITVQNEPAATQTWDSCIYSAEEEGAFVRDYLGPILEEEGLSDVNIYIWDHNRDIIVERAKGVLEDKEAAKYVYGVANHWYVSEAFENLSKVHELYPDKHILFSEGCMEGGVKIGTWSHGEAYARNMIGDFNNWQEGWLDWNLVLDEIGGPNHVGNYCDAPIIADTKTQEIHYNSSYYYIAQFSKYVKPGAKRIAVEALEQTEVKYVGFKNTDGQAVIILLNETNEEQSVNVQLKDKFVAYTMPAHSIATLLV